MKLSRALTNPQDEASPAPHKIVVQTQIKDNEISEALEKMWKTDFIEKQSEDRAMSKEDRLFMKMMRENVTFKDGHYVLPLPIKREKAYMDESGEQEDDIQVNVPQMNMVPQMNKSTSELK